MKRRKSRTPRAFTEKDFNQMKLIQSMGKNTMDASRIFGRSSSTTSYVFRANTFSDYQALVSKTTKKQYIPTYVAQQPEDTMIETLNQAVADTLTKILETLDNHTEMLKLIPKRRKF